jgi:hypothetical protein
MLISSFACVFLINCRIPLLFCRLLQCILDPFNSNFDVYDPDRTRPGRARRQGDRAAGAEDQEEEKEMRERGGRDYTGQSQGASPCSMCESRLPPSKLCYAMTSSMIQSTIIHMRSRLPGHYWPDFCRDQCYAVRSMTRVEGDPFNVKALTVASLRICELCYEICNKEMALIEIEQKLAAFARKPTAPETIEPTEAATATAKKSSKQMRHEEDDDSIDKAIKESLVFEGNWNPTENFRLKNRPSVVIKSSSPIRSPTKSSDRPLPQAPGADTATTTSHKLGAIAEGTSGGGASPPHPQARGQGRKPLIPRSDNARRPRSPTFVAALSRDQPAFSGVDNARRSRPLSGNAALRKSYQEVNTPASASSPALSQVSDQTTTGQAARGRTRPLPSSARAMASPGVKPLAASAAESASFLRTSANGGRSHRSESLNPPNHKKEAAEPQAPEAVEGRRVSRSELRANYTMCRMMMGVHQVSSLYVIPH